MSDLTQQALLLHLELGFRDEPLVAQFAELLDLRQRVTVAVGLGRRFACRRGGGSGRRGRIEADPVLVLGIARVVEDDAVIAGARDR